MSDTIDTRALTLADASQTDCCGNDAWRGHLCEYHKGYQDGADAVLAKLEDAFREKESE